MTGDERASHRGRKHARQAVDYAALAQFRYAIRRFLAFSEAAAAEAGLTSQQHQALLTIKGVGGREGLSVGTLAERLLVRQHTAVELVDRLERAGLVRRGADPADGRRVLVVLTQEGEERLSKLSTVHLDELRSVGPALVTILAGLSNQAGQEPPAASGDPMEAS